MKSSLSSLIHDITYKPKERVSLFKALEEEKKKEVLLLLSQHVQAQLLSKLDNEEILPILEHLDPDDTTDLLQTLSKKRQKVLLELLSDDLQSKVSLLLEFDPKTAAGVMSLNYILVKEESTIGEVAEQMEIHERRTGKLPVVVVLKEQTVIGFLPGHRLAFARPTHSVQEYTKKISVVKHTAKYNDILDHFSEHPHSKVVVLGENKNVLGVIYADDVLRLVHEHESASLYDFAGVSDEENIFDTVKNKVKSRYKWLIINLGTAFLAAFTVGLFEDTIAKHVLLAVYMPIVAGMGGNAATQTLAVLVRGIALNQIDLQSSLPTLKKELGAALINGLINGLLVAIIVIIFNRDLEVAFVLGIAMIVNLLVAGFFGTLVPLIMTKLGKDPATSATIFITTATDVLGFMAFLGLATILLN